MKTETDVKSAKMRERVALLEDALSQYIRVYNRHGTKRLTYNRAAEAYDNAVKLLKGTRHQP